VIDSQLAAQDLECLVAGLLGKPLAGVPVSLGLPDGQDREGPSRVVPGQVDGLEALLLAQIRDDVVPDEFDRLVDLRCSSNRDQTCVHDPSLEFVIDPTVRLSTL
jgi:hypothetical protein